LIFFRRRYPIAQFTRLKSILFIYEANQTNFDDSDKDKFRPARSIRKTSVTEISAKNKTWKATQKNPIQKKKTFNSRYSKNDNNLFWDRSLFGKTFHSAVVCVFFYLCGFSVVVVVFSLLLSSTAAFTVSMNSKSGNK
jgi:hypothetical protein